MRRLRPLPFAAFLALSVAACVQAPPPPAPTPSPTRAPTPAPLPVPAPMAEDWQDWTVTPGTWTYRRDARGSIALFGEANADARATLRCDREARRLYLSRTGNTGGNATIRTSSMTRMVAMTPVGDGKPYVAATLEPRDPLLDAIAFSRGRFTIELPGAAPLVLRPWAEFARVVEDCRG